DGHAKNFSIFLRRNGYIMTPLYDVLSAWPIIGKGPNKWAQQDVKLAMAVRGNTPHRHINEISTRHWRTLSMKAGIPDAFQSLLSMVEATDTTLEDIESTLPTGFPGHVWSSISKGVRSQRERFLRHG
ncbi:MAG: HipA domain-containing protein, partial [Gemmatimonadaceae bacterium]